MEKVRPLLKRPQTADAEFFSYLLRLRDILHLFHFNTTSYAQHVAVGDLYETVLDSADELIEIYQGQSEERLHIIIDKTETVDDILPILRSSVKYIETNKSRFSSDIINKLEELMGEINRTIYKLKFLK